MNFADPLSPSELQGSLGEGVIGCRIVVLASTRSTNDFLIQMLTPQLPEGLVVFAEEQTAGRGQRGNRWVSAPFLGLWFSILLRPRLQLAESTRLTKWVSQAIVSSIEKEFGLKAAIKPPNDVYLGGRKIAGILVEMKAGKGSDSAAIVGIGVNVNHAEKDFPLELRDRAGSIAMVIGRPVDRLKLAVALLQELDQTRKELAPTSHQERETLLLPKETGS